MKTALRKGQGDRDCGRTYIHHLYWDIHVFYHFVIIHPKLINLVMNGDRYIRDHYEAQMIIYN